jgi:hypothetical protein
MWKLNAASRWSWTLPAAHTVAAEAPIACRRVNAETPADESWVVYALAVSHVAELLPTHRMLKSWAAAEVLIAWCRRVADEVHAAEKLGCCRCADRRSPSWRLKASP